MRMNVLAHAHGRVEPLISRPVDPRDGVMFAQVSGGLVPRLLVLGTNNNRLANSLLQFSFHRSVNVCFSLFLTLIFLPSRQLYDFNFLLFLFRCCNMFFLFCLLGLPSSLIRSSVFFPFSTSPAPPLHIFLIYAFPVPEFYLPSKNDFVLFSSYHTKNETVTANVTV